MISVAIVIAGVIEYVCVCVYVCVSLGFTSAVTFAQFKHAYHENHPCSRKHNYYLHEAWGRDRSRIDPPPQKKKKKKKK